MVSPSHRLLSIVVLLLLSGTFLPGPPVPLPGFSLQQGLGLVHLSCLVDSSCVELPGARQPASTTHKSGFRPACFLFGPCLVQALAGIP